MDLVRVDANGNRVVLASTTISAYNVTADSSLGTIASDAQGVVASGSFTATAGDIVRFTHATYPGEHYVALKATKAEAFAAAENAPVYVLENLYTNTNESRVVHLYAQDTDNLANEPVRIGTGKLGETASIPLQSAIAKTYKIFGISEDDFGTQDQADFHVIESQEVDVPALLPEGAIVPYVISEFTTVAEPDLAAAQAEIGTVNPAILRFDMPVIYTGASTNLSDNIFVEFEQDGKLTVSNAATTVTINALGALPPSRQIFAGGGKVVLGRNATHEAHFEWWAGIESSGDDRHAMDQALLSTGTGKAVLRIGSGEWCVEIDDLGNHINIEGSGNDADAAVGTILTLPAAVTNSVVLKSGASFRQVNIRNLVLSIGSRTDGSHCFEQVGINGQTGTGMEFNNVSFYGIGDGAELVKFTAPVYSEEAVNILFHHCTAILGTNGKAYIVQSPNTVLTFINPTVTMGVGSYAFYLERTGMVDIINRDIRGPAPSGTLYDATYTADRTVTGSITAGDRTVTLSVGSFNRNDEGQYIGSGAWLAYVREVLSATTALVSFEPASTITGGTMTIYRFDDHPNLAYCGIYTGPASMGSLNIIGGSDEAIDYSYIGGQAHYAGNVTLGEGAILQGRIKLTASIRIEVLSAKWFAGAWEVDSGADVMVNFWGGYNFATTCYQAALTKGKPWGRVDGVVRCSNEFYTSEEIHVNPADYNDVTTNWSKINRPEGMEFHAGYVGDAVTDPVVNISAALAPPNEKVLLRLSHRDHTHPGPFPPDLYYYDFYRNNTDGALELDGNQTGFVGLRINGFLEGSDVRNTTIYAPFEGLQAECETEAGHMIIVPADNLTADRILEIDLNNAARAFSLSGNLTVTGDSILTGNNSGDNVPPVRTIVSSSTTVSPAAGDAGKEYRLSSTAQFNLPASAGCTAGYTVFYVTTLATNTSILPNGSDVMEYWDTEAAAGELASTEATIFQGATVEARYMGSGKWSLRSVKLGTP